MARDDESRRLAALKAYDVLDTPPEAAFDHLTALAADLLEAPIALISLIDEERQWFKSKIGLDLSETPREAAFCPAVVERGAFFEICDTHASKPYKDSALVTGAIGVRYYAGAPLTTPEGFHLGAFCVLDRAPRAPMSKAGVKQLTRLAELASGLLEQRRDLMQIGALRLEAERSRLAHRAVFDCMPARVWVKDDKNRILRANRRAVEYMGVGADEVEGMDVYDAYPKVARQYHDDDLKVIRSGEPILGLVERATFDTDGDRWVQTDILPYSDPEFGDHCVLVVSQDVTGLKRAERRLQESEKRFSLAAPRSQRRHMGLDRRQWRGGILVAAILSPARL